MKKSELTQIYHALNVLKNAQEESNPKFRYGIKKNLSSIETEINVLKEIEDEDKKILKEMFDERDNFIREKGNTDEMGNKVIPLSAKDLSIKDEELVEEFKKFMEGLEEKYKTQTEEYNKKLEEYTKMLQETEVDGELKFHKINLDTCPDWTCSPDYSWATDILIDAGIIVDLTVI